MVIYAGEDQHLFMIHSDLLSDTTLAILRTQIPQGGFCTLPEHSAETVYMYQLFLYTNRFYSITPADKDYDSYGRLVEHEDREWVRIAHAYFLGSFLKDERFANAAINALLEKVGSEVLHTKRSTRWSSHNSLMLRYAGLLSHRSCKGSLHAYGTRGCPTQAYRSLPRMDR